MIARLLTAAVVVVFSASGVFAEPLSACKEYEKLGRPGEEGQLLCRKGYLLAHDSDLKTPIWVAEHFTKKKAAGTLARNDKFAPDPNLPKGERAELSDYRGSGYDRGHMAPAADMKWDPVAMKQSFYLSNMVPQFGPMNRGIWANLEKLVRQWAIKRGELYIYTGPIYADEEVETVGNNEVGVPTHLYKIVIDPSKVEAIAFIMPNTELSTADTADYIVSIDEIEEKTGLDFLSNLKSSVQNLVESEKAPALWQ